ncbi:excisionase family DNA binding protein [Nonomuraea muscovyensis]|uniref:Excisionase family DNA binding protein n=1 Tax=Nonomuraea muscovyensis TaxID=1124761 RepID=A0A7X0BW12_9ACTN|nr:helix-turn-helix domain-containing protein [Nonomuraea muscovyensis]MBB6343777.1 excisionase family DNA binding protein [Nonomuraea muscovyensis]
MTDSLPRPAEHYVYGATGPVVVVPGRVAAWLERHAQLGRLRIERRGQDPEVDAVLAALRQAAAAWRSSATGTPNTNQPEPVPLSPQMGTSSAADLLGITDRAVLKAIHEGRLPAERVAGRWLITREDVEHFRAGRAA